MAAPLGTSLMRGTLHSAPWPSSGSDRPTDPHHVAVVTLDRPERLNALSIDLAIELDDGARGGRRRQRACRVVVLTGAGRAFCSGLDLKDYGVVPGHRRAPGRPDRPTVDAGVLAGSSPTLRGLRQPVIAAVNGPAYGGGMCLAMGCDLRFAGAGGDVQRHRHRQRPHSTEMAAAWLLPRQIGSTHANDLLLTGRVVEADEALRLGLVQPAGRRRRRRGAGDRRGDGRFSPYGLAMTKDVLWANLEIGSLAAAIELEDRNQLMLGFTENLPEAIRAFDAGPRARLHRRARSANVQLKGANQWT